ncbi:DUF5309 domain-containing protein [Agrobacterium rubi]|uniref:DUF5309 domain-containing protein n=1 Tax=Agrobacterium rubi TaxID=28099 RepID=A0ABX2IZ01_9HYPH|nr:DUF5309 domain-containing protein [Agrobacterium rubi]NTF35558.1 DUF5309 domain-containing protein [Agrobacterium rubi]
MAAPANTYRTTTAVGNRETLSDVVNRLTPQDTPIYSLIPKGTAEGVHPEWNIDALAAPGANVQTEGDEYTFGATAPPVRVGNYTQIFRKDGVVSNTQEAVKNAGDVEKVKEQKLKKGIELRKDVEFSIVSNVGSVGGATRVSGGLPSWLASNASRGATGANGGFSQGTKLTVPATNGTQRAFTKAQMDTVMQSAYQAGGNVQHLVAAPYVKSVFVTFMSDANVAPFRYSVEGSGRRTLISNADVYEGPFGKVLLHPNRVQAVNADVARNAFMIDPDFVQWDWLRKIKEDKDLAKTGDNTKFVLIGEGNLTVKNEAAHGVVADIFGLSPTT